MEVQNVFYADPATDQEVWDDDEPQLEFPLLYSTQEAPSIRSRLHVICALYSHTSGADRRLALLDHLEELTLQTAHLLAVELLENGWRPESEAEIGGPPRKRSA